MKEILLITDVDFWVGGAGHRTRIFSLIKYFSGVTVVNVIFIGTGIPEAELISRLFNVNFKYLSKDKLLSFDQYGVIFKRVIKDIKYQICIIEFIHNSYFLNFLNADTITILDIHDIISERTQSLENSGYSNHYFQLKEKKELKLFSYYNYIMVLTRFDSEKLKKLAPHLNILLAPHSPITFYNKPKNKVKCIGFVGSQYLPNLEGLNSFIKEVWPAYEKSGILFNIYGNVCQYLYKQNLHQSILLKGFVIETNEIYHDLDIAINPVMRGAGLKIKSVCKYPISQTAPFRLF